MIHLFKKIYLETDKKINVDVHRIIISEQFGHTFDPQFSPICAGFQWLGCKNFSMILRSLGASEIKLPEAPENPEDPVEIPPSVELFEDFYDFLNYVNSCYEVKNEPLVIYVDEDAFNYLTTYWYKILFPNLTSDSLVFLLKRIVWYTKLFSTNETYWNPREISDMSINTEKIKENFDEIQINEIKSRNFVNKYKQHMSIEFLISSYLYDESCIDEIIPIHSLLLRRNIENILGDLREKIYSYLTQSQFLKNMGIQNAEKYENFYDVLDDKDTILYFFFDEEVWPDKYLTHSVSSKPINFNKITEKYILEISEVIKRIETDIWEYQYFSEMAEKTDRQFKNIKWNSAVCNRFDVIEFVKYFKEKDILTEEEFKKVISYDLNKNLYEEMNFTTSFSSKNYSTVNNYIVDYIFEQKRLNNLDLIKPYVLR